MPAFITNTVHIQRYADAVYGVQVGSATLAQVNQDITSLGGIDKALNAYFVGSGQTNATVAANIVKNVGIVVGGTITAAAVTDATAYVLGQLNANKGNEGATIKNILNLVGNLTADPVYGAAAVKFNADVDRSVAYTGSVDVTAGTVVPVAGTTFVLTTGGDAPAATSADDVFNGALTFTSATAATTSTFNLADSIVGGAGADTLSLVIDGTVAVTDTNTVTMALPAAAVSVETVSIRDVTVANLGTYTVTTALALGVNADNFAGATKFVLDRNSATTSATSGTITNGVAFTNLLGTQTVSISGTSTGTHTAAAKTGQTSSIVEFDSLGTSSSVSYTAPTLATTVNVNSVNAASTVASLTAAGATTVNINAAQNLTLTSLSATSATTIAVSGAGNTTITSTLPSSATSVVSTGTGSLSVTPGAVTTSVTGGAGNDTVTVGTYVFSSTGVLNGGAGTDTIAIADSTTTVFTTASKANISGFETLAVTGSGKTFDYSSLSGLTSLVLNAGTSATISGITSTTPITVAADQATSVTFNITGATNPANTTDSLTLTLDKAGAATVSSVVTVAEIISNGLESLTIVSSGVLGNTSATSDDNVITSLASLSTSNLTTVTLQGASDLSVTTGAIGKSLNINGSAATGNLTIQARGDTLAVAVTGGSGADKIQGTKATDYIIGGAGNDRLVGGEATDATSNGADNLTGGAGADVFVFTGTDAATTLGSSFVGASSAVTGMAKVLDFVQADGDRLSLKAFAAGNAITDTSGTSATISALNFAGTISAANLTAAINAAFVDTDFVTSGAQALGANSAVIFNWSDRAFVVVNDGTTGYAATSDFVVEITGATLKAGDAALGTLVVGNYFV